MARPDVGRRHRRGRRRRTVPAVGTPRAVCDAHRTVAAHGSRVSLLLHARAARSRPPGGDGRGAAAEVSRHVPQPAGLRGGPAARRRRDGGRAVARAGRSHGELRRSRARHGVVPHRRDWRSGDRAGRRQSGLQLRGRHRRRADAHHARGPRRGPHLEHAATTARLRGLWLDAAAVCAPLARARTRSRAALEAARGHVGGRVPGQGLSAGSARKLPRAHRLVTRRRRRSAAACGLGRTVRTGRGGAQRWRLRRSEAGVGQSPLLEGGLAGAPGGSRATLSDQRRLATRGAVARASGMARGRGAAGGGVDRQAE